jgi:hypothetical protein
MTKASSDLRQSIYAEASRLPPHLLFIQRYRDPGVAPGVLNSSSSSSSVALQFLEGPWPPHTGGFVMLLRQLGYTALDV